MFALTLVYDTDSKELGKFETPYKAAEFLYDSTGEGWPPSFECLLTDESTGLVYKLDDQDQWIVKV